MTEERTTKKSNKFHFQLGPLKKKHLLRHEAETNLDQEVRNKEEFPNVPQSVQWLMVSGAGQLSFRECPHKGHIYHNHGGAHCAEFAAVDQLPECPLSRCVELFLAGAAVHVHDLFDDGKDTKLVAESVLSHP